jgi:hypothetical protein
VGVISDAVSRPSFVEEQKIEVPHGAVVEAMLERGGRDALSRRYLWSVSRCPTLAEVDSEERKLMEQGIGASALESAALGAQASRVVWTDDGIAAQLQRAKFGTKRVWTQAVLRWLNERGVLSNERYAKASARLLGFQYMFTSVNPEVLRSCGNQADWRPERWPLKQALTYLSLDIVRPEDAAFLSAMLVSHCYPETVLPETRAVLIQAASESLAKRTDGERSVLLFRTLLGRVFGLNAAAQQDATGTFEAWRLQQLRRLSVIRDPTNRS